MPSLQRLPVELLDLVLKAVANSATLGTAILSYKRFYIIYKAHPEIIHRCVLENSLSPEVVDAALRSIRIPAWMPTCHHTNIHDIVDVVCTKFHEDKMVKQRITDAEYRQLLDRARICDELEVVYSRWYKDRLTDRKSLLAPAERKEFRMCIHRLWLLSSFAGKDSIILDAIRDRAVRQRLFYDSYTSQDVYNLDSVVGWMAELVDECQSSTGYNPASFVRMKCIVGGPDVVLKICESPNRLSVILGKVAGLTTADRNGWKGDVRHLFESRKLLGPSAPEGEIPDGIVPIVALPEVLGLECWRCKARPGVRLWNETNWEHLPRKYRLEMLPEWLKGSLKDNVHERLLLLHVLDIPDPRGRAPFLYAHRKEHVEAKESLDTVPDMTIALLLQTLCEMPQYCATEHAAYLQQNEFHGVTAQDLLCKRCLGGMVEARLWVWWSTFKELSAPDQAKQRDCWYGFDCRTQASDPDHVFAFNHVCFDRKSERKAEMRHERKRRREARRKLLEGGMAVRERAADGPLSEDVGEDEDADKDEVFPISTAAPTTPPPAPTLTNDV